MSTPRTGQVLSASVPGHGNFVVTWEALTMIVAFGGLLHCYQGTGGCRGQGLYFSLSEPKKFVRCLLSGPGWSGSDSLDVGNRTGGEEILLSVSRDLAPKLDGAVLDFGSFNKMQRFVWRTMPAVKGPACTCRRSVGTPAGKRSLCLDDKGLGLTDL
ncbi:peptidase [Arthrobacter sp. UCD-GKA]|nr:peptidase [Arthrobacter sp. UCD-GKA]